VSCLLDLILLTGAAVSSVLVALLVNFFLGVGLLLLFAWLLARRQQVVCPHCGHRSGKLARFSVCERCGRETGLIEPAE
jgi:hypothetical protein